MILSDSFRVFIGSYSYRVTRQAADALAYGLFRRRCSLMALAAPLRAAIIQTSVFLVLAAVVLFGAAGTIGILAFWLYLIVLAAESAVGLLLIDPDLSRERMRPGGRRLRSIYLLVAILPFLHWAIAGLDRGRLHWSDAVSPALQVAALVLFALSCLVLNWAMHVNRFFPSVPRIQQECGHRMIESGPYRLVRRPGYSAGILLSATSGVALGSWIAAAFGAIGVPLLLRRTLVEDRMLRAELPGYLDYVQRVQNRLLPGVW
jgi:protein-S-isoprenylcysteine O-methyltransferase Ste14